MIFKIEWTLKSLDDLDKLDENISRRIIKKVNELIQTPYSKDIKKLKGIDALRLRVGDYRVIFGIDKDTIVILKVGHRKNIYERQ